MTTKLITCALWIAVSTAAQADDDRESLITQEADERALAARMGWQIVDLLRVPGHSRAYRDINKCNADMLAHGIDAYDKLMKYFDNKGFDVLIVRDGSRFARSQGLHATVTETIIEDMGARIYSLADGMIDESNYRMWAAMSGFSSATELDNLKKRNKFGMLGRLKHGKPTANFDTFTHRKLRDASGKSYTYAIREDTRPAMTVIADLLLQSQSYNQIARALQIDYAIPPVIGDAWYARTISNVLLSPITWGNIARFYNKQNGIWAFDEAVPLPSGVVINRNTHEPYWTGDEATRIQNELRRRDNVMHGRAWAGQVTEFSGLVYCGCCGYRMVYKQVRSGWKAFCCARRYDNRTMEYSPVCACKKKSITVDAIREWLTPVIEAIADGQTVNDVNEPPRYKESLKAQEAELAQLGKVLGGLYSQRSVVPIESLEYLNAEIAIKEARVAVIKDSIDQLNRAYNISRQQAAANKEAVAALRVVGARELWKLPPERINQYLHGVLNGGHLVVEDGEITRIELLSS